MKKGRSNPKFEMSPAGYAYHEIITNRDGKPEDYRFKMVNEAFERITGLKSVDIIEKTLKEVINTAKKTNLSWLSIYENIDSQKTSGTSRHVFEILGKHYHVQAISDKKTFMASILSEINGDKEPEQMSTPGQDTLESILENAPDGIYLSDLKGTFLYGNKKAEEIIGYTRKEVIGKNFLKLSFLSAPFLKKATKLLALNHLGKCTGPDEFEIIRKDKSKIWVEINTVPVKKQGKVIIVGFVHDISQRKNVDKELQRQSQLQNILMELSATYINIPIAKVEAVIETSLGRLAKAVDADRAYVFSYDFSRNTCTNTHEWCAKGIVPQKDYLQDLSLESIPDWVQTHRRGEAMCVSDVQALPGGGLRDILEPQDIKSLLAVPMIFNGQCIGFVGFDSVRRIHHYAADELRLLTLFAQLLVNVRERKQIESQREAAIRELRESEKKYRSLFENSVEAIYRTTPEGRLIDANPALVKLLRFPDRDTLLSMQVSELFHDAQERQNELNLLQSQSIVQSYEICLRRHDGTKIWVTDHSRTVRDNTGEVLWYEGTMIDITERKQAEFQRQAALDALRESEELQRKLIQTVPDLIIKTDTEGNITFVNEKALAAFKGFKSENILGKNMLVFIAKPDQERAIENTRMMFEKQLGPKEYQLDLPDRRIMHAEVNGDVIHDKDGNVIGMVYVIRDITDRKQAEKVAQKETIRQHRQAEVISNIAVNTNLAEGNVRGLALELTQAASKALQVERVGIWIYDQDGSRLSNLVNYTASTGEYDSGAVLLENEFRNEFEALKKAQFVDAHDALNDPRTVGYVDGYLKPNGITSMLDASIRAEGRNLGILCFEHVGEVRRWKDDEISFACRLADQISLAILHNERIQATQALRQSEALLNASINQSPAGILIADAPNVTIRLANPAAFGIRGKSDQPLTEIEVSQHSGHWQTFHPDGTPYPSEELPLSQAVLKGKVTRNEEVIIRNNDGEDRWVMVNAAPVYNEEGVIISGIVIFLDITDRKLAEAQREVALGALSESEEKYRHLIQHSADAIYLLYNRRFEIVNEKFEEMFGLSLKDINKPEFDFINLVAPKSRPLVEERIQRQKKGETLKPKYEFTALNAQGQEIDVETSVTYIKYKDGMATQGIIRDITERKKLERELRQAQKMESVGRLAGGVAHDFNNMLGVILGYSELALNKMDSAHPFFATLQHIRKAAHHSADLTRQLLAFARKQTVAPKVLNLNDTVEGMLKMLRRLMGEAIDLVWHPGKNLGKVKIDPSQIDQILANLCVNARDAIGDTGRVTIETHPAIFDDDYCRLHSGSVPGKYVLLSVSDTGCGMNAETLSHVFEPFFTTKEIGKGTGLGLATVYGIVKQNNGFINVYSEPGFGTTFKIYIPRYMAKAEHTRKKETPKPAERGHETILLVEDEPMILDMTTSMLEQLGYKVLAATTPGYAINLAREYGGEIHLLMTDVIMPEMNGRDLAKNLLTLFPDVKRLFMSGYTADVIAHHGVLDDGVHFVQKPFTMRTIANKIRSMLDQS